MKEWLILGFFSYLFLAISSSIDKKSMNSNYNPVLTNMIKMFFDGIIILIIGFFLFSFSVSWEIVGFGAVLGFLYAFSGVFYFISIQFFDIETVAPSMMSLKLVLVTFFAFLFLQENIGFLHLISLFLVILGTYILLFKDKSFSFRKKGLFFVFISVFFGAVYGLTSKFFISLSSPVVLAIGMYFFASIGTFIIFSVLKKINFSKVFLFSKHSNMSDLSNYSNNLFDKELFKNMSVNFKNIIFSAFFGGVGTLLLFLALSKGFISKVYLLSGLQPIFIAVVATLFLKEKFYWNKFFGILLISLGIFILSFI